jgi:hypothetical protein
MPYATTSELPGYVKKYSPKVRRQWMHVFNTVYQKTGSESRAFSGANSVLKTRFEKTSSDMDYHSDRFNHQVDKWLGNLQG